MKAYTELTTMRFERKFPVEVDSFAVVERLVKNHPSLFSEIFVPRWVNNIYFDTSSLDFFLDNQSGKSERKKVRIRWYGDLFGRIESPVLEIKIKRGLAGTKRSFHLPPFDLVQGYDASGLIDYLGDAKLPEDVMELVKHLSPTLINRYQRKYFLDDSKLFRITIDSQMSYHQIILGKNHFRNIIKDRDKIVIELKYDVENDHLAPQVTSYFPYRMNKHSKYVNGIEKYRQVAF